MERTVAWKGKNGSEVKKKEASGSLKGSGTRRYYFMFLTEFHLAIDLYTNIPVGSSAIILLISFCGIRKESNTSYVGNILHTPSKG